MIRFLIFFFFKQKTAYEIGLGIPAEPLFRSSIVIGQKAASGGIQGDVLATDNNTVGMGDAGIKSAIQGSNVPNPDEARSEERRVGKECRSGRSANLVKKTYSDGRKCSVARIE